MIRHFVSFPKSGRTWMRYMLVGAGVADNIHFHHDGFEYNDGAKPPLSFDVERRLHTYARVDRLVYMERDPKDVMVSLYHQVTGRFRDFFNYGGSISDFLRDDYFGAANLARFHAMWREIVVTHGFHRVTYEDCHAAPDTVLRGVLQYYGWSLPLERLREVADSAAFDKMKEVEASGAFPKPWLRLRNGSPKVRQGRVGGYRTALSEEDQRYLEEVFRTG